jgi:predicted dehydrogenase
MSSRKLRVGIIGAGMFVVYSHIPNFRKIEDVEIVAVSRRDPQRLAQVKEISGAPHAYRDWREMLEKEPLDAVVISTPHDAHTEPALAALEHGLHVLLEKPMALTSADAIAIVNAAEQTGRVFTLGYNSRGLGGWRAIKGAVDGGAIGTVRQLTAVCAMDTRKLWGEIPVSQEDQAFFASGNPLGAFIGDLFKPGYWRTDVAQMGGGMFVDSGTHIVDMMLWLGGGPATEAIAYTGMGNRAAEQRINAQGRLASGAVFSITSNDCVAGVERGSLMILGDTGMITANWGGMMATDPSEIWLDMARGRQKLEPLTTTQTPAEGFVACIRDGAPNYAPPREGAQVVALMEAIYHSAAKGRPMTVTPV